MHSDVLCITYLGLVSHLPVLQELPPAHPLVIDLARRLGGNLHRKSKPEHSKHEELCVPRISEYIMTFQVSTGKSASLKLQSNFSAASGSSVGS